MKYYVIRYSKKSHSDYSNPMLEDVFSAKDEDEYETKLESFIKGCEDYDVREISRETFASYYTSKYNI